MDIKIQTFFITQRRYGIHGVPVIGRTWNAKTKSKIEGFDQSSFKIMSFDHAKVFYFHITHMEIKSMKTQECKKEKRREERREREKTLFECKAV